MASPADFRIGDFGLRIQFGSKCIAECDGSGEGELRPVCGADSKIGGVEHDAECEGTVGGPPGVATAAAAGGLLASGD